MADQNTLYSQGFNFSSFVQDDVDPRTGQFTSSISLYETPAEIRNCASFKLGLKFSPSNAEDIGFGKGWSLNLSKYQHINPRSLLLSTGEHYQVVQDGGVLRVVDQKLQKFKFQKKESDFQITHKDDRIEILSNSDNVWNTSVVVGLYAPNGRRLTLTWVAVKGQPRLSKILEGSEELLQINYGDPYVEIVRAPGTARAATFTAVKKSGKLREFWMPLTDKPKWEFDYQTFGKTTCLTSIRSPIGLAETVTYKADGHKVPQGGPSAAVPYVVQHIADPGNQQPAIRTLYSYSTNNFFGYGGVDRWKNGKDNLYNVRDGYLYTATVSVSVDGGQEITYTYNKFHLLVKTQQVQNKKQTTQSITYHAKENVAFEHQPPQFQLPRSVLTNYRDLTDQTLFRDEQTQHAFDEWGNPTMDIQTSGVRTDRVYYPPDGEEGSCPADPHGFQRFLKEQTVTPAKKPDPAPVRTTLHTYRGMPTAADAPAASFVLIQKSQIFQDGRSISTIDRDYVSRPDERDHGRLRQKTTTVSESRATVQSWTHQYPADGGVTITVQQRGFDGCQIEGKTSYSLDQGLAVSHVDQSGVQTELKYDQVGRLLSTTVSPGTSHEATQKNKYTTSSETAGSIRTVTDVKGVKTRQTFDGLQRLCQIEKQDDDGGWDVNGSYTGTFRVVQQKSYKSIGQCSQVVDIDWLRATGGPEKQSISHRYEYDDWGQVCKVTESSGVVTLAAVDPISQTRTEGIEGLGKKRTRVESEDVVVQATLLRSDDTLYTSVDYANDGLGRRVQETDGRGNVTRFSYDWFDRVSETTWPNGSLARTQYADHSVDPLPVSVQVQDTSTGEQSYDGLSRVTKKNSGGRTTLFSYKESSPKPSSMTTPKKSEVVMVYDEALDYALKDSTMPDDQHSYNYNDRTGELMQSKSSYCTEDLKYLPSGLLKTEDIRIGQSKVLSTLHTYSMNGKLQRYSNVHGQSQELSYDDYGRLRQLSQGPLTVTLDYDAASRLRRSSVKDSQKGSALITELVYDDFGRERERTLIQGSKSLHKLIQDYDVLNRVKSRELKDGGDSLRQESFGYDNMSRLIDYQCQGSQLPVDERGRQLRHQMFSFTTTGGIAEVTTNFQDGSKNVALHRYSNNDPSQLIHITNSHPDEPKEIDLEYDANGCLILDEQGRKLEYNTMGCLTAVISPDGTSVLSRYHYDARGKLVCQEVPGKPDYHLYYRGDNLIAATSGDTQLSYVSDGHFYWGQILQEKGQTATSLWASDAHQSTIAWLNTNQPDQVHTQWYTPYGSCAAGSAICWNGQWRDPVTGWYHLGNGYRVYNPVLMRFHTPDSWSPFTSGEINAYTYCLGDPVNRVDPSGHSSVSDGNAKKRNITQLIVGLVVSILAAIFTEGASLAVEIGVLVGTGVAADMATGLVYDAATGTTPTWESVGSDALSSTIGNIVGLGVAKGVGKLFKAVGETLEQLLEGAAKIQHAGGARTLRPPDMELNQLISEEKFLKSLPNRSVAQQSRLGLVEAELGNIESSPKWKWEVNMRGRAAELRQNETILWNKYYRMRRLVSERRLHPAEAAKQLGDTHFESLGSNTSYSIRLSQAHRVYFHMNADEHLVRVTQVGGHR